MPADKLMVYLDSNVFIFGKESPESNSRIILDLAEGGKFVPVVSFMTLEELREYFSRRYGRETGIDEIYYLVSLPILEIVSRDRIGKLLNKYKGVVPDKDLPHLVSAIGAEADYFITYSRHFLATNAKKYVKVLKQADFVKLFGIGPQSTDC